MVTRIGELGTTLAVTSNRRPLRYKLQSACDELMPEVMLASGGSVRRLLVIASVVPSSPVLVTLMRRR
jgi:hypothetical protein